METEETWLTQEDVANIARIKYGWHGEDNNVIFEIIGSVEQLGRQLTKQNIDKLTKSNKQSLTFIVNLNNFHWVTLVVIYSNQQFSAYYIDSLASGIQNNICSKLSEKIREINIQSFSIVQQNDGYNCGIFALENAKIINDVIESGQIDQIEQKLKGYKPTSDDLENKRKEFAKALIGSKEDSSPKRRKMSSPDPQHMEVDVGLQSGSSSSKRQKLGSPKSGSSYQSGELESHGISQKYPKFGLVHTLHGDIYQLKLLMLFVKRGLDKEYLFELATEMGAAEKFDDLVFQYKKSNADGTEEKVGRFLQAKHKQDESKKISVNDLLTEKNGEFSLQKYFISYRKIQQNREFKNGNLKCKDFVICTNIGFKFDDKKGNLKLSEDIFNDRMDENDILNTQLFQFKDKFTGKEQIVSILRNAPDLTKLAKRLAECVLDGKSINDDRSKDDPESNLFKSYQSALIDKVIDKESHKLSVDFVKGQQLPAETKNLRVAFEKVFNNRRESFNLDDKPVIKDPEGFAQKVAELILKNQPNTVVKVEKRKYAIKDNFDKLAGYVLIKKDNKIRFSTAFLDDDELPGNLKTFREKLRSKLPKLNLNQYEFETYKDFKTCEEIYVDKNNFWEKIKEKKLKLFEDFGKLDTNLQSAEKFVERFVSLLEESTFKENRVVKIKRADKIINKDIDKLAQHVLIEKEDEIRFSSKFFSDTQLPGNLNYFRSQLKAKLEELDFNFNILKEYTFYISNFPKFNLPDDSIDKIEGSIKDFLDKLRFAVNQPNEDKLGEIIKEELGKKFNMIDRKNVYSRFLEKMLDWMKDKEGKFFTYKEGGTFFEEIKKEILGTIWFDVKDPVQLFTGRKRELSELHKTLQRNQGKDKIITVISQMTSISGLGGIGKSELARKYAYAHGNDYDGNVIWINAENYDTLKKSFLNLAKDNRLGIVPTEHRDKKEKATEAIVKEIYVFFAKRKSLFIFDNAEKNEYLNKFLPLSSLAPNANKPYILITSRNREWEKGIEVMDLNELELEDAIKFVKKGLGIEDKSQDQEIKTLVEKLQRFPLAIQQAIAYIEDQRVTGGFSIDDYLEEYEKKTKDLLDSEVFKGIDNEYAKTTFTTWKITIDKIASDSDHGQLALKILDAIAYFAPESVNREIFLDLAGGDERKLRSAVRLLVKYSMVNGEKKQSVLSIHRLVQEVTRLELKGQEKEEESLKEALKLVETNFKKDNIDHAMSAWSHASKYEKLVKEFSSLPRMVIEELYHGMRYSKTLPFEKEALKSLEKLGNTHYEVLIMKRYQANAYGDLGDYEKKRKLLEEEVLPTFKKNYGDNHLEFAKAKRNLANAYGDLNNHQKKKELLEEVLAILGKYYESDHVEIEVEVEFAKAKRNLGNVYRQLAKSESICEEEKKKLLEEGEKLLEGALPVLKRYFGSNSGIVTKTHKNLEKIHKDKKNF
ncbi:PREDICTED: uncharacterized protein LOC105448935 isoform X2 [Wasmannia auropunctata]|uniref:uncharacterized protein LOC105448935 isoform X2 n=1 Tax=Wasmannia auropunctata TaxID=64793 RepID=UPI0005EEA53D|nr:PREDICTED: uncharacterized protein LOC105448935 isoform X2 [Wasmannia auropunctata]